MGIPFNGGPEQAGRHWFGEGFFGKARFKAAEILCVFQGFDNEALAEKTRRNGGEPIRGITK